MSPPLHRRTTSENILLVKSFHFRVTVILGFMAVLVLWGTGLFFAAQYSVSDSSDAFRATTFSAQGVDYDKQSKQLAAHVYAEYPELDPDGNQFQTLDDWQRVIRLREFSYRHTAYANNVKHEAYQSGAQMVERVKEGKSSLAEAYAFFDAGRGGVVCGHTAELLRLLYQWAGYEAWYLNIGFHPPTSHGSSFTHALTLVRIEVTKQDGKQQSVVTLHDPSVNLSYVDAEGQPIDYFDMLVLLARREANQIGYGGAVSGTIRRSDPITVAFGREIEQRRPEEFFTSWNVGTTPSWNATPDGWWIFTGPRTVTAFERLGDVTWKPELICEGYPPETIYLHCFPFIIRGTEEGPALLRQAHQVLAAEARVQGSNKYSVGGL